MLALFAELIDLILQDCDTDTTRKMFLSCCKSMRSLACRYTFDNAVDSRHLESCPYRHSNVWIERGERIHGETYTVPAHITRISIVEQNTAIVDLRLCTRLQYLDAYLCVSSTTLLNVPDSVEQLYLFDNYFTDLPRLGNRQAELIMYSRYTGINERAMCYLPSDVKIIGAIDSYGACCIMPIPRHNSHCAVRWTDGEDWQEIIKRQSRPLNATADR